MDNQDVVDRASQIVTFSRHLKEIARMPVESFDDFAVKLKSETIGQTCTKFRRYTENVSHVAPGTMSRVANF